MKSNKLNIFFYFLIFLVIILSSCSRCPKSCNDGNSCTMDFCDKTTDFECAHEQIPNCHCGNKECEEDLGENKCTCEKDCGKCKESVNEYVEYRCVDDECVSKVKESVEIVEQTVIREVKTSYFRVDLKITYEDPLNVELSNVISEFRLDDINKDIRNFKITGITIFDDKQILMNEQLFTEKMTGIGNSFEKLIPLKGYSNIDLKKKKTLYMEISYEYEQKYGTEYRTVRASQKQKFGPVLLINADSN
ncbi:hypothetical protein JXB41_08275 [Candidatus Woesearchaeota archaeon]|nr:hypothetical protein [Candidatus Woesearchaeota archaeon]